MITVLAVGLTAFTYTKDYIGTRDVKTPLESEGDYKIVNLHVDGITCAGCAKTIKSALLGIRGVKAVSVSLESHEVKVGLKEDLDFIPIQELLEALEKKGYKGALTGD